MKYCITCGRKLTPVPANDSWEEIADCMSCLTRHHVVFGDAMGGSADSFRTYPIPKKAVDHLREMITLLKEKLENIDNQHRKVPRAITLTRDNVAKLIELLQQAQGEPKYKSCDEMRNGKCGIWCTARKDCTCCYECDSHECEEEEAVCKKFN